MDKQGAIEEMKNGNKVAHRHFSTGEWMKKVGLIYEFEDGCRCTPDEFWRIRTDGSWNTGWRVVA